MKKLLALLLVLSIGVVGCGIPAGVKGSLYTAEASLRHTVADADAANSDLWKIPDNATAAEALVIREKQVAALLSVMGQAAKNLEAVIDYFRTGKERKGDGNN